MYTHGIYDGDPKYPCNHPMQKSGIISNLGKPQKMFKIDHVDRAKTSNVLTTQLWNFLTLYISY